MIMIINCSSCAAHDHDLFEGVFTSKNTVFGQMTKISSQNLWAPPALRTALCLKLNRKSSNSVNGIFDPIPEDRGEQKKRVRFYKKKMAPGGDGGATVYIEDIGEPLIKDKEELEEGEDVDKNKEMEKSEV